MHCSVPCGSGDADMAVLWEMHSLRAEAGAEKGSATLNESLKIGIFQPTRQKRLGSMEMKVKSNQ